MNPKETNEEDLNGLTKGCIGIALQQRKTILVIHDKITESIKKIALYLHLIKTFLSMIKLKMIVQFYFYGLVTSIVVIGFNPLN